MQNLVVLINPADYFQTYETSLKAGNMCLNRFCIDEDAAFEFSGVYYLKKYGSLYPISAKGKELSFFHHNLWY